MNKEMDTWQAPSAGGVQAHCCRHLWILLLCIHNTKFHLTSEALNRTRFFKGAFVFKYNFVLRTSFLQKGIICINIMGCHKIVWSQINYRSLELWPLRSPVFSTNCLANKGWNWSPRNGVSGPSSRRWSVTGRKRKTSQFLVQHNVRYKVLLYFWHWDIFHPIFLKTETYSKCRLVLWLKPPRSVYKPYMYTQLLK